jgi:hypothetical protein
MQLVSPWLTRTATSKFSVILCFPYRKVPQKKGDWLLNDAVRSSDHMRWMIGTSVNETERKCTALDGPDRLSNIKWNCNQEKRSPNPEPPDYVPRLTDQIKQLCYCLLSLIQDFNYNETTERSHINTLPHLPPGVTLPLQRILYISPVV